MLLMYSSFSSSDKKYYQIIKQKMLQQQYRNIQTQQKAKEFENISKVIAKLQKLPLNIDKKQQQNKSLQLSHNRILVGKCIQLTSFKNDQLLKHASQLNNQIVNGVHKQMTNILDNRNDLSKERQQQTIKKVQDLIKAQLLKQQNKIGNLSFNDFLKKFNNINQIDTSFLNMIIKQVIQLFVKLIKVPQNAHTFSQIIFLINKQKELLQGKLQKQNTSNRQKIKKLQKQLLIAGKQLVKLKDQLNKQKQQIIKQLIKQKYNQQTKKLNLNDDNGDNWISVINYHNWQTLKDLQIRLCGINCQNLVTVTNKQWPQLKLLNLHDNQIGSEGAKLLAKANMPMLETLFLTYCLIGTEGMSHIVKGKWKMLQQFGIQCNCNEFDSYEQISKGEWKQLKKLWITTEWTSIEPISVLVLNTLQSKIVQIQLFIKNAQIKKNIVTVLNTKTIKSQQF